MWFKRKIKPKAGWLRERFVTLMVIPERTRKVHKVVVPFFMMRLSVVVFSLLIVFVLFIGVDYLRVLGRVAENKRLKGQNFKLRQEIQLIRNKVDTMEFTIERVSNYAKKLQLLTGQAEGKSRRVRRRRKPKKKVVPETSGDAKRVPAMESPKEDLRSSLKLPTQAPPVQDTGRLTKRLEAMGLTTVSMESELSNLQEFLVSRRALALATPSIVPLRGYISSGYGYRFHPYDGQRRLHRGVDIVAEPGTPVRAPAPGTVVFSGDKYGYGKVVVIDHGFGIRTLFAHNSKTFVARGAAVKRGDIISQVGSTGRSTGPHLHYEIRKNGIPVNPAPFLANTGY